MNEGGSKTTMLKTISVSKSTFAKTKFGSSIDFLATTKNQKILASVKEKPIFVVDNFVLYHNDCLKILEQLPNNSIDMIFADPPYNLSNGGFTIHAGRRVSVNKGEWDKSKGLKEAWGFHS